MELLVRWRFSPVVFDWSLDVNLVEKRGHHPVGVSVWPSPQQVGFDEDGNR